jgi:ferredoxin
LPHKPLKNSNIIMAPEMPFLLLWEVLMVKDVAVIAEPCVGVCDTACVDACPVDCIHGPWTVKDIQAIPEHERKTRLAGIQMFVDPRECIGCWACIPACPVNAIFEIDAVPEEWTSYIELNAHFYEQS